VPIWSDSRWVWLLIPRILRRLAPFLAAAALACDDSTAPPPAFTLEIVEGDGQTGDLYAPAARNLVVRVLDESGRAAAGVDVVWRVLEGAAGVEQAVTTSDSTGLARVRVTFGIEPGAVRVLAQVAGESVSFRLEARRFWRSAGAGYSHSCALSTRGAAYCWGANASAQLGDDTETARESPVPVFGGPLFTSLSVGWFHTCGITMDGALLCWGGNDHGQLGVGDRLMRHRPARVAVAEPLIAVSAGYLHTCAVGRSGAAYCWGTDVHGALGSRGTNTHCPSGPCALIPARVESSAAFTDVAAGEFHTCGLVADGGVWCWGWNSAGELGTDEIPGQIRSTPVRVRGTQRFTQIAVHARHSCAVSATSEASCWGRSATGEIGTPDHQWAPVPLRVSGVRSVATGYLYTCALTDARTVCFGDQTGQTVRPASQDLPGPVFSQLSMGFAHSCGVADHEVWCWGSNVRNQVGHSQLGVYVVAPTRKVFPQ
jgi:alpha-tubulin suppressor-like RCC1 family protein